MGHPRRACSNHLLSTLTITPQIKLPNARSLRRLQRHISVHAQQSDAPTGENPSPQLPIKPLPGAPSERSSALTALLRSNVIPDATVAKQLGLTEDYLQALMELPGTTTVTELKTHHN